MSKENNDKTKDLAVEILSEIWRRIDWNKSNYINIGNEFVNKVSLIAMTTDKYEIFIEKLCRKLGVKKLLFPTIAEVSDMDENIKCEILKLFREQPQILFLKMKLQKQNDKEGDIINED
ncbi:hypothetical protein ACTPEW_16130 [Clostridioides difficile]